MGTSPITIGVGNGAQAPGKLITTAQGVPPPAQNQPPGAHQAEFAVCDQTIERLVGRLKEHRRIATRYDKTAESFLALVQLAASRLWLRFATWPRGVDHCSTVTVPALKRTVRLLVLSSSSDSRRRLYGST